MWQTIKSFKRIAEALPFSRLFCSLSDMASNQLRVLNTSKSTLIFCEYLIKVIMLIVHTTFKEFW